MPLPHRRARESGAPFDCVITDIELAGGIAGDSAAPVEEIDPDVGAIACTGHAGSARCVSAGFRAILHKPFTINDIALAVHGALHTAEAEIILPRNNVTAKIFCLPIHVFHSIFQKYRVI